MKQTWSPAQQELIGRDGFMISAATVFPNLCMVHNWPRVEDSDDVLPFITLRTWQPVAPDETEVLSWFAVDASAPEEFKALSYKAYLMCFGSTGMFEQDDVENWVSLTSTAAGSMARRLLLNSRMGTARGRHPGLAGARRPASGQARGSPTSATPSSASATCSHAGPTTWSARPAHRRAPASARAPAAKAKSTAPVRTRAA